MSTSGTARARYAGARVAYTSLGKDVPDTPRPPLAEGEARHVGDEQILDGISGSLCRCTGYQGIIAAVRAAARVG